MKSTLLFAMLSMVFAVPAASAATESTLKTYTVRPGDGLERIARKNGCSLAALTKANGLKPSSMIHPGQTLKLPGTVAANAPVVAPGAPATLAGKTHTIREGDTYSRISRKYGVSLEALVAANPNAKATALRPGQVIRLSAAKPAPKIVQQAPAPPAVPTPPAHEATPPPEVPMTKPAPAPAKPAVKPRKVVENPPANVPQKEVATSKPEKKIHSVMIQEEMTYADFAAKYGTDIERLNDLNGLDLTKATVLAKGSELYVPAQP